MQIEKIENNKQKLIITYLIVSDKFIEELFPVFQENKKIIYQSFSGFYRIVLEWCIDYYQKYGKAPKNHIQNLYEEHKLQLKEEEQNLLSTFLQNLSDKYEEQSFNEKYIYDLALKYLREVNINVLQKQIEEQKKAGLIDEAENLILTYDRLDKQTEQKQETQILKDIDTACKIVDFELNQNEDGRLFKLKGDLGDRLGWIYRENFMSILGVAKIGKSFMLREIALNCLDFGLNVIIFNLEMSHDEYLLNFYQNMSQEIKDKPEECENIKIPYFDLNLNGKYDIKYESVKKFGLNSRKLKGVFNKTKIKTKGDIIVRSFPSNTLTYNKMKKCLDDYALRGFVVDVVLIDYLDNLKSIDSKEHRHSIDEKWIAARRLAQEIHAAVITVSHTNKKTFHKDIDAGDETEDVRKCTHITHSLGLNQTPEEKAGQVMRINIIHSRSRNFNRKEMFVCLECREIGKVLLDNMNIGKVNYIYNKERK